jgi:hypothetical protein
MKKIFIAFVVVFCISAQAIHGQTTKTIDRDSFSLKYPEKWAIDKQDPDYDPDALFSVDAPDDQNMIMFFIFNMVIDADEMLAEQVKAMSASVLKNPEITDFTDWGKYKGKGKLLKGKFLGVFKGTLRLFFYADDFKSMLVMEYLYDSATEDVKKEMKAIADSFSFKK